MGGRIFVGVRTASGVEHIGETWTNWLPLAFAQPDTYEGEGGRFVEQLVEHWNTRNDSGFADRSKRIRNSEYGVVLLDIPSKEIWEHNAYFTPLCWGYGSGDSREYSALLVPVLEKKQYSKLELYRVGRQDVPRVGPPTEAELATLLRIAKRHAAGGENGCGPDEVVGMLHVYLPWGRLVHERAGGSYLRSQRDWDAMRTWAQQRGWKSPINKSPRQ